MGSVENPGPSQAASDVQQITGGQIVAKMLKQEGIGHIFTISGGHIVDIYNGCLDEGIQIIDVRHEQVAAHAADAYARITGLGCAVVTAGPGTTDAVTAVSTTLVRPAATAIVSRSPRAGAGTIVKVRTRADISEVPPGMNQVKDPSGHARCPVPHGSSCIQS